MGRRIYIILAAQGLGGAEKRFSSIWHRLLLDGYDIHLVVDHITFDLLCRQPDYANLKNGSTNIHRLNFGDGRYRSYCAAVMNFFKSQPSKAIVHYPLAWVAGTKQKYGHTTIVSWVDSSFPKLNAESFKNSLGAWLGFTFSDWIDVLNPSNLKKIATIPFFKNKCSLTSGGTQVDPNLYSSSHVKNSRYVFLGRTEPEKQCFRFAHMLPEIHEILCKAGHTTHEFIIRGSGSESLKIRELLSTKIFQDIPVDFGYTDNPNDELAKAAIFFSLQRTSNYPSKALAEAMVCGAFPILTETGESDLMVKGCENYAFVPKEFTARDIASAILKYENFSTLEKIEISKNISSFALERFDPEVQITYFKNLYKKYGA